MNENQLLENSKTDPASVYFPYKYVVKNQPLFQSLFTVWFKTLDTFLFTFIGGENSYTTYVCCL